MRIDPALIAKYNVPGPRYTSYPSALHFTESISSDVLLQELQLATRPLSLYVHLPFCRSLCWYCGCTTVITRAQEQASYYLNQLETELDYLHPLLPEQPVVQIHFGGGTPTFLTPEQLLQLGTLLRRHFTFAKSVEFGVELDPRTVTSEHIEVLREIGCNRVSLGIQDIQPRVQHAINRIQPWERIQEVFEQLRKAGFLSINVDLIYGLPYQTPESFQNTLTQVASLHPDRWAVFGYAHVPWMKPAQKLLERHPLPQGDTRLQIFIQTIEYLTAIGYRYIGLDHFARPEDELSQAQDNRTLWRNFQGYSTHAGVDIIGLGMSAISQIGRGYFQNMRTLDTYYQALQEARLPLQRGYLLSRDDEIRRYVIMQIMCNSGFTFAEVQQRFNIDMHEYFSDELQRLRSLEADALITCKEDGIWVTEEGRLFIRNIAMIFDRYLKRHQTPRYSRTL